MRKERVGSAEMVAVVATRYGGPDVLEVRSVPVPRVRRRQVLIRVHATAVTAGDVRIRSACFPRGFGLPARLAFGLTRPRNGILGGTYSGVVTAIGSEVGNVAVGDEVCGMTGAKLGTWAEFVATDAVARLARKPTDVTHHQAAALLLGGTSALFFVRDKLRVAPGESVAINGASGAVGRYAVQLAHHLGAEVTAVARGEHERWLRSLGAGDVIDRTCDDVFRSGRRFDVVLDTAGTLRPRDAGRVLTPGGRLGLMAAGLVDHVKARGRVKVGTATERGADIAHLLELAATEHLAVRIDRTYDLADLATAHEFVDAAAGTVGVIVIDTVGAQPTIRGRQ